MPQSWRYSRCLKCVRKKPRSGQNQAHRLMRVYFYDRFNLGSFIQANHSRMENNLSSLCLQIIQKPPCFKLELNELSCLDLSYENETRTLKSPDRFLKPRSVLVPKVDKWRLCWDYNKDAKAIIQSTLTNAVPFCEQMGPRVWVGKQAEYPSPSWLEKTRINGKPGHRQESPTLHVILCLSA